MKTIITSIVDDQALLFIKAYRGMNSSSLKEAKDICDQVCGGRPFEYDGEISQQLKACCYYHTDLQDEVNSQMDELRTEIYKLFINNGVPGFNCKIDHQGQLVFVSTKPGGKDLYPQIFVRANGV